MTIAMAYLVGSVTAGIIVWLYMRQPDSTCNNAESANGWDHLTEDAKEEYLHRH